jgi:AcrR family transcriptional regulator
MYVMPESALPAERPLRRDAERNRQRILDAARVVFAERGLSGSHDDIAREAGVGVGTVYRRFPDKEQLIDALFEARIEEIADVARAAADHPDPWQALVGFLTRTQELQSQDRGLKEIVLGGARGAQRALAARSLIAPLAARILQRAQDAGVARSDIELTDLPLIQLAIGTIAESSRDIAPDVWRRMMTIVIDGLRADCARSELASPAIDQDQANDVMACYGTSRRSQSSPARRS